ncbi:MAG: hypothetical protein JOZ78_20490 [Chroococcidiopsidaceae cyanobacterium CP_BM_ER_R8_30]|nr:hypothetical protein [Chroococcidiopsidaceae cyanobacterium CP_BM_ER_R8_30]
MSHFNFKSIAFYGTAIAFVVVLFEAVTAYGEKNLKAPVAIDGSYPLSFTSNSPVCLKSTPLLLNINQSGTYLNASLSPKSANSPAPTTSSPAKATQISLTGRLNNQQVNLLSAAKAKICPNGIPPSQISIQGQVEIQGQEGKSLKGNLTSIPGDNIAFTAQRQPFPKKAE